MSDLGSRYAKANNNFNFNLRSSKSKTRKRRKQSKNTKQTKDLIKKTVHNEMAEEKAAAPLVARNNRIFNELNDVIQAVSLMPSIGS